VGTIGPRRIHEQTKLEILTVIEEAREDGVSIRRSCSILMIEQRRILRWQGRRHREPGLTDAKPGPRQAPHRLLREEIVRIAAMARSEEYADLSHRVLALTALEKDLFVASFSSVYRVLKAEHLTTQRGHGGRHNGRSLAPVRKELSAGNQRWCWDISYLPTLEKGIYLYLYLVLDEFSRKAIAWHISWVQTAAEALKMFDLALRDENILDLPEEQRPEVINDRGRQMKAKPIQRLFEDHQMPRLLARPRTPDDNPFIESAFSTVKRAPEYPGCFRDDTEATAYFHRYFDWYNNKHYHSGIDYVTPKQAHQGLRQQILDRRARLSQAQRIKRRTFNQNTTQRADSNHPPAASAVA
jgi:putative transposase